MMEKKRFTEEEKCFLLLLVHKNKSVVESRDTDAGTLQLKKNAWYKITELFNREPRHTTRTTQQLQKLLNNLKNKRKKELVNSELKRNRLVTSSETFCKETISDSDDTYNKDNFNDINNDDAIDNLGKTMSRDLPRAIYEPIVKLEPAKTYPDSRDCEKTLYDLKIKEAEVRLMIAQEQLEEAKIRKETALLIQNYEIRYYKEKVESVSNFQSQ